MDQKGNQEVQALMVVQVREERLDKQDHLVQQVPMAPLDHGEREVGQAPLDLLEHQASEDNQVGN